MCKAMNIKYTYGSGKNRQFTQYATIFFASMYGLSVGLSYAWPSPSLPILVNDPTNDISLEAASYFMVITAVAMLITAPIFSKISDAFGRKKAILFISVPQLLLWILTASSQNIWVLYVARFMYGVSEVIFYATCPMYVCEIAEPKVRGTWGNLIAMFVYLGIFLMNVIGSYCSIVLSAVIGGCIAVTHLVAFIFMPESPYYLLMKNREQEATESLMWLRWRTDVEEELEELKSDVKRQVSESSSFSEFFTNFSNRKALIMCSGIFVAQQLSGLSAFELYTQYMFEQAGSSISEKYAAQIFSGTLFLASVFASYFVEKLGRKPLMIFSCLGCGIALAVETVYFAIAQFSGLDVSQFGWIPLAGMLVYIVICASGIAILPTLVLGEVFSANFKGKATAIMNSITAVGVLIVPKFFQTLTHNFGIFSPFSAFAVFCFLAVLFSCFYVIETKGKTLEEIQQTFKKDKSPKKTDYAIANVVSYC